MHKYYLYRHIRLDKNEVFYIGVGSKPRRFTTIRSEYIRAYSLINTGRGKIWERITAKTKYDVEILFESDNYSFILDKEKEFIKLYGRINKGAGTLANLTDGGKGMAGFVHSEESKKKMSASRIGYKVPPDVIKKRVKSRKGYLPSEDTKKKMSISAMGNINGKGNSMGPIVGFINGILCYEFSSVQEACNTLNLISYQIYHSIKTGGYCKNKNKDRIIWKRKQKE